MIVGLRADIVMLIAFCSGGCKKISHVFYPDGSELARRSKFVAWRAAVEMSKTVAQLTFLVIVIV